jgi:hypothetical protein
MKSAYELAMERLRKKDAEEGRVETPLTDEQRAEIADIRSLYASKIAEAEILLKSKLAGVFDPAEREEHEANHRREIARLHDERDTRVERVRTKD